MRWLVLLVGALVGSGCFTAGYLSQAAGGQVALLRAARPLQDVIGDASAPEETRRLLAQVPAIKRYGQAKGLTPTKNYQRYADLQRDAAVWVVQGCAPVAFEPRRWWFPIVGSVPYLGFFTQADAQAYAKRLAAEEPLDVTVRTASAYSTLGWFADPVLSTMVPQGPLAFGALANVILHESVHATVYVPGQSAFDESLASFVADGMTLELLRERFGAASKEVSQWEASESRQARAGKLLSEAWEELDALYRSPRPDEEKRAKKAQTYEALRAALGAKRVLNNADLAGRKTYGTGQAAFARLKQACGTWPAFLAAAKQLKAADFGMAQSEDFDGVVEALAMRACGKAE